MLRLSNVGFIAILLLLVFCVPALAEDASTATKPVALSLNDCIILAFQNQIDVVTATNNIIIAKSKLAQNKSAYLPQVSVENNAFVIGSQGVLNKNTTGSAFSVSQLIFDGGLREASVKGARYGVQENSASLSRTRQTVAFDVTKAYYDVLRARHLAEVSEANVKYNEALRDQIQLQAEQGEAAKVDVLPVEAQLANARVNYLSAKNSVRTAALELQIAMGVTPQQGFDVQEVDHVSEPEVRPLNEYTAFALKDRPDVLQTQAGLGAARASVRAARISLYPRPVISGDYQKSIAGGFQQSGGQITGGIAFNLFDGGASRAAYKGAQAAQANQQQQALQLDRNIKVQVEEAYLNLTSAKERMDASQAGLTAAEKNLEAQKDRYSQGLAITLDLLNAEVQLVTAQSNLVQAKYDYYTAISQMNYAVGTQGDSNARQSK